MSHTRSIGRCLPFAAMLAGTLAAAGCGAGESGGLALETIELPSGFSIEVAVTDVPNARSMTFGDDGTLFVGTRGEGALYAVTGWDEGDPRVHVLADDMNMPNGVAFRNGALYVAEVDRILRYEGIEARLQDPCEPELIARYPSDRHHGWKYIAFGPDDRLYVPIGAPCNICNEEGYAVITSIAPDGNDRRVYAEGVRNTVGFTWHPETNELWFTDNGRDHLGNDVPPCELNHAAHAGLHFGYPYCHGRDVPDPEFGDQADCEAWGRPVDLLQTPDGDFLLSDDRAGVIYRIRYHGAGAPE